MDSLAHPRPAHAHQTLLTGARTTPFVGRERELAALTERLEAAGLGEGGVVLVSGEPGIGKSRLLLEIQARAHAGGWLVLSGRAYDTEGMPPYLAFAEAIAQYLRMTADDEAGPRLAEAAREVALLVPELGEHLPNADDRPSLGPEATRYRLFQAVSDFFLRISATSEANGLLLCLDDLHWADRSTLLLFQHLTRKLPGARLLVAGAFRTEEVDRSRPLFDVLAELAREQQDQRLTLARLSPDETSSLVASLSGATPAAALAAAIHHQTEGNPFFVQEVVRHLQSQEHGLAGAGPRPEDWGLSEGVREVIGRRLSRLGVETQRLLESAAVLGDGFEAALLRTVARSEAATVTRALEEALPAAMLREEGNSYVFGHPLIRQVIYEGLSLPRRQELHLRAAEAIETIHAAGLDPYLSALATHYFLAGAADPGKATGYAMRAGDRAAAVFAFEEASRLYDMALDAHERSGEQDETRRCEMLLALATATAKAGGSWERVDEIHLTAAEAARAAGLPELLARACLANGAPRRNARLIPLLEDALAVIPGGDSPRRSGLLAVLAYQRSMAGSWEESASIREESITMARRLGDARALAFSLFNAAMERSLSNHMEEHLEVIEEVIQLARELGDKQLEVNSHCDRLHGSLVLGDIAAVDAGIEEHARLGDELQQRNQMMHPPLLRSMRALLSGPLSRAEQLDDERERIWRRYNSSWLAAVAPAFRLVLGWEQGRLAELQPACRAALDRQATPLTQVNLAFICSELGEAAEAQALVQQLGIDRFAAIPFDLDWAFAASLLSQACSATGDAGHSGVLYDLLLPRAGYVVTVDGASACLGSTSRYLGMLATTLGRFDDAERHFDDADAMNTRLGAGPLLAHAKVDRARMHLARHARGDLQRAQLLLEEAGTAFEGLEMDYHAGKARELAGSSRLGSRRRPYPDGLTEREVEVLRLITQGKSNREIGAELVLSLRTVERHIVNIYSKLDIHSKAQATAYVFTHELAQPL